MTAGWVLGKKVPGWGERAGGQGLRGVLRRGGRMVGWRAGRLGSVCCLWVSGAGPVGTTGSWTCVWHSGKWLGQKTGLEEPLPYGWDLQPGRWLRPGTHRGLGEQGEVGRGEEGVGRSGRADAPSSSGSRI